MKTKEQEKLITEKEFTLLLNEVIPDFFKLINLIRKKDPKEWPKRYYSILSEKAHTLECYLDDFHARNNKKFGLLRELFASIKWFGYTAFLQQHILIRYPDYATDVSEALKNEFIEESLDSLEFMNESIIALLDNLAKEGKRLKLDIPEASLDELASSDPYDKRWLPHNIDEGEIVEQNHIIAEVATHYKQVSESLAKLKVEKDVGVDSIKNQTLFTFDETKTRHFESQIHNIQSKYDTYIKKTAIETNHPELTYFRGHASLALHLFEMATILVHFYERHETDIRYEKTIEKISAIIPKDRLLRVLNSYIRYYGIKYFLEGEKHADAIIKTFIAIKKMTIKPEKGYSLHARPLSLIAKIALYYNTPLEVEIDGTCCNASSIMQMILLVGKNPKPDKIIFRGEVRALQDIKTLFKIGFFKDGDTDSLPAHLQYLAQ